MSFRRVLILSVLLSPAAIAQAGPVLPANFYDTLMNPNGNMDRPTATAFAPDGRIFVCQQAGALRVIKNGALLAAPFLTVTTNNTQERGLLGVAFDPAFTANRYIYVYYTFVQAAGSVTFAGATTVSGPVTFNRVTRFTADATNPDVAQAGSEVVILNIHPLTTATNHNGGAMHFGNDGKLYIATGENANGANAQSMANLLGKILRINTDGSIPTNNPFYGTNSLNNRAIWCFGLRNPFTFAFRESSGRMFINDVGQNTWEEINDGTAGANYGWPATEGAFVPASFPAYTHPTYFYQSNAGPCAITGGCFQESGMFPAPYDGKYFFADYCSGWIRYINPPGAGVTLPEASYSDFATGYGGSVDLQVGPDGAMYVLNGANTANGQVHRIHYSATAAPAILNNPSNLTVSVGQNASFTVSASGAAPVTFQWQRDTGAGYVNIAGSNSPTYNLNNAQLADSGDLFRVIVSNMSGSVTSTGATLTVTTNTPPTGNIVLPLVGTMFNAGTTVTFSGNGTDAQDGTLTAPAFTWWVDLHHDVHTHPAMAPTSGVTTGTFVIPNTGEMADTIFYRFYMVLTDSGGMSVTLTRDINPNKTNLVFQTNPPGLNITLEGIPFATSVTVISVVGMIRDFGAPNQGAYTFASWSDGGAQNHFVTVGAASVTYTANFTGPTATATRTSTRTLTATSTSTATATRTSSATSTPSATFTSSSTRTLTSTPVPPTATSTSTLTRTSTSTLIPNTPTLSATSSATSTPTLTSTASMTPTLSATLTASSTRTPSPVPPTGTSTPTASPSSTATSTLTQASTSTATLTSTGTLVPTSTPTLSGTSTATSTDTSTASATPSPSATATASSTSTAVPSTSTATPSMTSSMTTTSTVTPSPTRTSSATSTSTALAATVTATLTSSPTATPSSTPSASATPSPSRTSTSTNTPTETLTATASPTRTFSPTLTPTCACLATATATPTGPIPTATATLPPGTLSVGNPYPNPAPSGMLSLPVTAPLDSQVVMTGYTPSYKKVLEKRFTHPGGSFLYGLDLTDLWGQTLANGVYYLKVELTDPTGRKFIKTLTLVVRR